AENDNHGAAIAVGDRDREADHRHHPGSPRPDFVDETGQKRTAAGAEDRRGEDELDEAVAAECEGVVEPEPALDVSGEHEHRNRQDERDPEAPPEVPDDVVVMAGVSGRPVIRPGPWCPRSGLGVSGTGVMGHSGY